VDAVDRAMIKSKSSGSMVDYCVEQFFKEMPDVRLNYVSTVIWIYGKE